MSTPQYQAVPHGDADAQVDGHYPPQPPRPATYYGEGEFDPPSSDDEEETFLEKHKAEGPERDGDALEEDGELVVGRKVCAQYYVV